MTVCGLAFSTLFSFAAVALFISAAAGAWVTGSYDVRTVLCGSDKCTTTTNVFLLYSQQLSQGRNNIYANDWFKTSDTWAILRAACASLYIAFVFALLSGLSSALQLVGCLPAVGTRVVILYATILAVVWGIIGTVLAGVRVRNDIVNIVRVPPASEDPNVIDPGAVYLNWTYAFACSVAATVIMTINIGFALWAGTNAHASMGALAGTLSPAAPSASKPMLTSTGGQDVAIPMRSLE